MDVVTRLDIVIATLQIMGGAIICIVLVNFTAYLMADLLSN